MGSVRIKKAAAAPSINNNPKIPISGTLFDDFVYSTTGANKTCLGIEDDGVCMSGLNEPVMGC